MPLVLFDYTIQAVWSFCNSQLTVTVDRTTRTASGAEEIKPLSLHFFLDITNTIRYCGYFLVIPVLINLKCVERELGKET